MFGLTIIVNLPQFKNIKIPNAMKRIIISFFAFALICTISMAQVPNPILWLRADSTYTQIHAWRDLSGNGYDAVFVSDSVKAADTLLNFNPAFRFDGTTLFVPPIEVTEEANSVIIVYQTDTSETDEMPLWSFQTDSAHTLALTTRRIVNVQSTILYNDADERGAVINILTQLWRRRSMADTLHCIGSVGFNDTSAFTGMVSEIVVLPCGENFSDTALKQWSSYLAVKYGVTLKETSYLSSDGTVTWPLDSLWQFSGSVIGIGRDDRFGLYQRQSRTADGLLTLALDSITANNTLHSSELADREFLMMGSTATAFSTSSELYLEDDQMLTRYGDGVVKVTGNSIRERSTVIKVDASKWTDSLHNYALLIDRSGAGEYRFERMEVVLPSEIDTANKSLTFNGINWDTDESGYDFFCFAALKISDLLQIGERGAVSENGGANNYFPMGNNIFFHNIEDRKGVLTTGQYSLYPNPNSGHFVLEAQYPEETPLTVCVYSADGKMVHTYQRSSNITHRVEGSISSKGQYLIEIVSNAERNLIKMIVQ